MFDTTTVCIYHKQKGEDGKVKEHLIYRGVCKIFIRTMVREVLGGAENSSDILVHIPETLPEIECGDRVVSAENRVWAVQKCTVCPDDFYLSPLTILHLR